MVFIFFILLPSGVVFLRVLGSVRWHGLNQFLASVLVVIGTGVGIYSGTMYNRSKHLDSAHQIFGLIIMAIMILQLILGYVHHRLYKRTQQTTLIAPIHLWLGRLVILFGIVNAYL